MAVGSRARSGMTGKGGTSKLTEASNLVEYQKTKSVKHARSENAPLRLLHRVAAGEEITAGFRWQTWSPCPHTSQPQNLEPMAIRSRLPTTSTHPCRTRF